MSVPWTQTFVKMAYVRTWEEATVASVTSAMSQTPVAKTVLVSQSAVDYVQYLFKGEYWYFACLAI